MNLLDKFKTVEVKSNTRISDKDKAFCETHQLAYDAARSDLKELMFFWNDILDRQKKTLSAVNSSDTTYLSSQGQMELTSNQIQSQLDTLHSVFIASLVQYFNKTYHITIREYDVEKQLIPQKPDMVRNERYDGGSETMCEDEAFLYEKKMEGLSLNYQDILDQIFAQIDGRDLWEQALHELLNKCHAAAWSQYSQTPQYELKKNTIKFVDNFCAYAEWRTYSPWELFSDMNKILIGAAHFETGSFSQYPQSLSSLINGYHFNQDTFDLDDCNKIKQLKLYKNGRVDLKFSDEEAAGKFASEYLGTVY